MCDVISSSARQSDITAGSIGAQFATPERNLKRNSEGKYPPQSPDGVGLEFDVDVDNEENYFQIYSTVSYVCVLVTRDQFGPRVPAPN